MNLAALYTADLPALITDPLTRIDFGPGLKSAWRRKGQPPFSVLGYRRIDVNDPVASTLHLKRQGF